MSFIYQLALFTNRRLKTTLRSPAMLMMTLMTPLIYLLFFAPLLEKFSGSYAIVLDQFMPGMLILTAFTVGMGTGWYIVDDDTRHLIEQFRVMPIRPAAYIGGTVLYDVIGFLVPAGLLIAGAAWAGFKLHWFGLLTLLVLGTLFTLTVSALIAGIGLVLRNTGAVGGVVSGIQLPLMLLSGVMLPISYGPTWIQNLAKFNPMYYVVRAAQNLNAEDFQTKWVLWGFSLTIVLMVVSLLWSTKKYRKLAI